MAKRTNSVSQPAPAPAKVNPLDALLAAASKMKKGPGGKTESPFANGTTYADIADELADKGSVILWVGNDPDGNTGHFAYGEKLASAAGRINRVLKPETAAEKGRRGFATSEYKLTQFEQSQRKQFWGENFDDATMGGCIVLQLLSPATAE